MLSLKIKEALKKNWGEKADNLNCYAEVKLIDPLSSWSCYVFAMDDIEENIKCVLYSDIFRVEIIECTIYDIFSMYNSEGENPRIDNEFRRIQVTELLRKLKT